MTSAYLVADETLVNRKKNIYIEKYKASGQRQQACSALTAETLFYIGSRIYFFPAKNCESETLSSVTSFEKKFFKSLK